MAIDWTQKERVREYKRKWYEAHRKGPVNKKTARDRRARPRSIYAVGKGTTIGDLWDLMLSQVERNRILEMASIDPSGEDVQHIWDEIPNRFRHKVLPRLAQILKRKRAEQGIDPPNSCSNCEVIFSDEFPQHMKTGICHDCFFDVPLHHNREMEQHRGQFMDTISQVSKGG